MMQEFWFYIKLGFNHVLDLGAYDHILFLCALAIPFTFNHWKKIVLLASIFTVMHCLSLALSVFDVVRVDMVLIEFLIPLTIGLTALFNIISTQTTSIFLGFYLHSLATAFFGLIHGFGFSNYFNMLMAEEAEKWSPLLGFAAGIEVSQLLIIFLVLLVATVVQQILRLNNTIFIVLTSIILLLITIPMLIKTFPW